MTDPLPGSYFDDLYAADPDPWRLASRWYERRKRALTLAALPDAWYGSVFEPGCGGGLLTESLARRCGRLLATDVSAAAVEQTRRTCAGNPSVEVRVAALPADWPEGTFDLIVCSEILYYLGPEGVADTAARVGRSLSRGGSVVAVHWRHPTNYPQSGDAAHAGFDEALQSQGFARIAGWQDADLVLGVWSPDGRSVAGREGLDVEGTGA